MLMWVVGGGVAVAAGIYLYEKQTKVTPVTPAQLPAGTVVTTLIPNQKYTIAALLPAGVLDQVALADALKAAGWTTPNILYFMGQGAVPSGVTAPGAGGYVASATWGGVSGPVPAGVVVITAA